MGGRGPACPHMRLPDPAREPWPLPIVPPPYGATVGMYAHTHTHAHPHTPTHPIGAKGARWERAGEGGRKGGCVGCVGGARVAR